MLGEGPKVRSTWVEFPVLLYEISMTKMEHRGEEEREREKQRERESC
jgi:hypothetical protein